MSYNISTGIYENEFELNSLITNNANAIQLIEIVNNEQQLLIDNSVSDILDIETCNVIQQGLITTLQTDISDIKTCNVNQQNIIDGFNSDLSDIVNCNVNQQNEIETLQTDISDVQTCNVNQQNEIDILTANFSSINNVKSKDERKELIRELLNKYGLASFYVNAGDTNENIDNLDSSEKGLDRFGMGVYDELPKVLKDKAIEHGYKNINYGGYEGVSDKSLYSKGIFNDSEKIDHCLLNVFISEDDDSKFTKNSPIMFMIDLIGASGVDFTIEIVRERHDTKDIEKLLEHSPNFEETISKAVSDRVPEHRKDNLEKMIMDIGIDFKEKDRVLYHG